MIEKFLPRTEFESYEDFKQNYKLIVPENFNFAYDIIDEWARQDKTKEALLWCNDEGGEKHFTFEDLRILSNKTANVYKSLGVKKGDKVMLILKQRPEAWICILALCKIGAVCIPATFQLTTKDVVYRCNAASIKMITMVDDDGLYDYVKTARPDCETLENIGIVGNKIYDGCLDFRKMVEEASDEWTRPTGDEGTTNDDTMLMYFTSGTSGMPKMATHSFTYPLGHITTAKYWQHVEDGGRHLTMSDSGWAKFTVSGFAVRLLLHMTRNVSMQKKLWKHLTDFSLQPSVHRLQFTDF